MPRLSQTSIDLVDTGFICNIVQERKTQSDRKSVQYIYIYISILIAWSNYVKITIIVRFIVSRARLRGFESIHIVIPDATHHKYQNWIPIESETRPFQTIIAFVTFGIMNIKKTSTKAKIYYNFLSFLSNLNK